MIAETRDFMKARSLPRASVAELLDAYRKAAKIQSSSTLTGDYKTGNPQADIIATIYRELRNRGGDAQNALLDLLDDEDAGVRGWAAAHALEIAPAKGIPVLEALAQSEPWPLNTNAEMTLKVWKKGELRFP